MLMLFWKRDTKDVVTYALQIKAEGTQVLISTEYENQYSVNIPFVVSFYKSQQRAYAQATKLSLSIELGNACL